MPRFVELKLKADVLQQHQLPDISYPVPLSELFGILGAGGDLPFAYMLYWLQEHSAGGGSAWRTLEPAMHRLAEFTAPKDAHATATVRGEDWFMELRPVDLEGPLVTIQRQDHLLAALQPRTDGTLACSVYRPLDAKSIRYLIGLSHVPGPDGNVCMRPNNWEYALDQAAHVFGASYAAERGKSYLSLWEQGLGVVNDGSIEQDFMDQRQLSPVAPNIAATQLGVYYELHPDGHS
ncbi:MAG: hypothetical protein ABFS45_24325 [Pseudomonadota bacterium]